MTTPHATALTYQQRCAIQALKHGAYAIGCLTLGDAAGAAAHSKAASAWGALAIAAQAAVIAGLRQELLDATWVEPLDYLVGDDEEPVDN